MGLSGEDELKAEVVREEATTEETTPTEEVQMLSQNYYLIKHPELDEFIAQYCSELLPAFSHLNTTSNIDARTERLLRKWIRYVLDLAVLVWRKKDVNIARVLAHEALYIRSVFAISDARNGWKGRLFITRGRTVRVESEEKERRGLFW